MSEHTQGDDEIDTTGQEQEDHVVFIKGEANRSQDVFDVNQFDNDEIVAVNNQEVIQHHRTTIWNKR